MLFSRCFILLMSERIKSDASSFFLPSNGKSSSVGRVCDGAQIDPFVFDSHQATVQQILGRLWWYSGAESVKNKKLLFQIRRGEEAWVGLGLLLLGNVSEMESSLALVWRMMVAEKCTAASKSIQIRWIYHKLGVSVHETASFSPFAGLSYLKDGSAVTDEQVSTGTLRRISVAGTCRQTQPGWKCCRRDWRTSDPVMKLRWTSEFLSGFSPHLLWMLVHFYVFCVLTLHAHLGVISHPATAEDYGAFEARPGPNLFCLRPSGHHKWKGINAPAAFRLVLLCPTRWWNASEAHGAQISGHPRGRGNYAAVSQWACPR